MDSEDVVVVDIANVVPSVTPPADQTAVEGSSKSFNLGSFTDPGPDNPWTVDIDWGDTSPHTTFTMTNTGSLGSQSHTYPNGPASKTVTVKVHRQEQWPAGRPRSRSTCRTSTRPRSNPQFVFDPVLGTATASFNYADAGWKDTHTNSFFRWSIDPAGVFKTATITGAEAIQPDATGLASYTRTLTGRLLQPHCHRHRAGQRRRPVRSADDRLEPGRRASTPAGFRPPIQDNERQHRQVRQRRAREGRPDGTAARASR